MTATATENIDNNVVEEAMVFSDGQWIKVTSCRRYFDISGVDGLTNGAAWAAAALSATGLPKINDLFLIGNSQQRVKKRMPYPRQKDASGTYVEIISDDSPLPGLMALHGRWLISTRQCQRQSFVDRAGNQIAVVSPRANDPSYLSGISPEAKKSLLKPVGVPQLLTQKVYTRTQFWTVTKVKAVAANVMSVNKKEFLDEPAGNLLFSGLRNELAAIGGISGSPDRVQRVQVSKVDIYRVALEVISAGDPSVMEKTLGTIDGQPGGGKLKKKGWDQLGWYTESTVERIPRPLKTARLTGPISDPSKGVQELIVSLYDDYDFTQLGPGDLTQGAAGTNDYLAS